MVEKQYIVVENNAQWSHLGRLWKKYVFGNLNWLLSFSCTYKTKTKSKTLETMILSAVSINENIRSNYYLIFQLPFTDEKT